MYNVDVGAAVEAKHKSSIVTSCARNGCSESSRAALVAHVLNSAASEENGKFVMCYSEEN